MKLKKIQNKKTINIKPFLMTLFFVLLTLQVVYTIQISSYGGKLAKLENDYKSLAEENEKLTRNIVGYTSLTALYEQASTEGYVKPGSIVYIKDLEFVASAR